MRAYASAFAFLSFVALSAPAVAQAPAGDAPPQQNTPQQNTAEIAFWTSVKDTKNPAEMRAYLAAFPNGLFTQLARLRLEEMEKPQQAAPRPAPPPPPVVQQTDIPGDLTSTTAVRDIQIKLYALNYDPGRVDGTMIPATRTAIREWQEVAGFPITGVVTEDQFKRLRDAKPSSTWAAVAYTANGANGWVFNRASRATAEQEAVDLCIKRAGQSATCKPITASGAACITMASYTTKRGGTTYFGTHVAVRANQTASISEALRLCGEAQNSGNNCSARVTICADGSHKK